MLANGIMVHDVVYERHYKVSVISIHIDLFSKPRTLKGILALVI